jgi:cell division protein FtsX
MIAAGIFYLVLGIRLVPWINGPMIEAAGVETVYQGDGLAPGSAAFAYLLDWMGTFGLELLVLGAAVLVAARDPERYRLMAHVVLWHEIVVGVAADAWFISRTYIADGFYLGFIAVHLAVIASGIWALRRAPRQDHAGASQPVGSAPAHQAAGV